MLTWLEICGSKSVISIRRISKLVPNDKQLILCVLIIIRARYLTMCHGYGLDTTIRWIAGSIFIIIVVIIVHIGVAVNKARTSSPLFALSLVKSYPILIPSWPIILPTLRSQIVRSTPRRTIHLDRMAQPHPILIPKKVSPPATVLTDIEIDMSPILVRPIQSILAAQRIALRRTQIVHFHDDAACACESVAARVRCGGQLIAFPALFARPTADAFTVQVL